MRFTVETWDPSYGSSVDVAELEPAQNPVDADVEQAAGSWRPVPPSLAVAPAACVTFVDGVRRIDARVWIDDDGLSRPGVCATVAAGAVRADGQARLVASAVFRGLFAPAEGAGPIVTRHGTYELVPTVGDGPEAEYLAIHQRMTLLEREVSDRIEDADADAAAEADADGGSPAPGDPGLIVFDGPLRGRSSPHGIGYVKSQHVRYLDEADQRVLGLLGVGERSPVFLIGGPHPRWSWYLRLPGPRSHPLAGIVRCEAPARGAVADAVERADVVARTLPRFASEPHKDARAPQNLYPIAGLEHELRRRLGDPHLLERALRVASRPAS